MTTKNVFFIDSRVSDYQSLITSLRADSEWVLIDGSRDGVLQMQSALAGHSNLDSIQVISHGSAGTLYLGSTVLGSSNLESYSSQLRSIGSSLTDSGDLLLYGCNVAQGDAGKLFIDSLAAMSQADVAASNDLTGGSGDLILEVSSGDIEQGKAVFAIASPLQIYSSARDHINQLITIDFSAPSTEDMSAITPLQLAKLNSNNLLDQDLEIYDFLVDIERMAQIQDEFFLATSDINALFDYMKVADYSYYQSMLS